MFGVEQLCVNYKNRDRDRDRDRDSDGNLDLVACAVAWLGMRRMHQDISSAVCTRCAWLECLSFLLV